MTEISPAERVDAYKSVFSTPEGQIALADLMRHFGFTRNSTYVNGELGGTGIYIREGQRSVLIHIGNQMDMEPENIDQGVEHG